MKKLIPFIILLALIPFGSFAQDSLTIEQLKPFTYTFDVVDGEIVGEAKAFFEQEMAKAQFTMLGEYHGSKRISEFTTAIIPILDKMNYKTMALEVGPITGHQLHQMESPVTSKINQMHKQYLTLDVDGDENLAFPFFSIKEDAKFLDRAKQFSWNVFGIDQEFYNAYVMLSDLMFENLSEKQKNDYKILHSEVKEQLYEFYKNDDNDVENFHVALSQSNTFKDFLKAMQQVEENSPIIDAMHASSAIYLLYHHRKWYENNATRIKYMKSQLRQGLSNFGFDLSKDKLLIKMGSYHLGKGFSPLSLYEVGNTLNEIAAYHGNSALNIAFTSRFWENDNRVEDNLNSERQYFKNQRELLQMGQENQWVVIDLRQLIKGYFYHPKQYNFNPTIEKLVERYDLIVIPKTEVEGIPNYD
ncbi:hypothetical protein AB9K26_07640 [Psychroserpens sp. XS_ASV72]|uniref:hypothetical protein n=1 Tax=Psychroserpens sp. XS_ASV72 TaxID=3241293 RepID=UPI0035148633